MRYVCQLPNGGSAPATLGFNAVTPEWLLSYGAADAAPAIPAAESTLGSHPCVALSSAQVLPEWINRNLAANAFSSNGDNPLNFVSHSRGSLQFESPCPTQHCRDVVQDGGSSGFLPRFLRMDSPVSSMRKALCTNRSRMLSATEGSPICSCQ
jgi:hypothetical protein